MPQSVFSSELNSTQCPSEEDKEAIGEEHGSDCAMLFHLLSSDLVPLLHPLMKSVYNKCCYMHCVGVLVVDVQRPCIFSDLSLEQMPINFHCLKRKQEAEMGR